ncbi:hypothetical protein OH710_06685 [Pseudomonas capsici]|uniref:hypothetical protein n=1 Tax=Pseudomonas capsici TaxID=2810614 RepID=UPI0021F120CC|nr:hypothetical protein [Pseudomonas capsici]MCV4272325.1 hypothetical protein [Pseudomonas capsici]
MNMPLKARVIARPSSDQHQLVQGRQFALDIVESFGPQLFTTKGIGDAIKRLTALQANKPKSFAQGIQHIVDVLVTAQQDLPAIADQGELHE